ncbi:MAG: hypothetical protein FWF52_09090 [Candidatus Azobacteroides sp.]|nr:hypothetical protein [Candidatus Azobacteroides sp.]
MKKKFLKKASFFLASILLAGNVNASGLQCEGSNILADAAIQLGTVYYAPGWNSSSNYTETWENNVLTLHLTDRTYEAWQAQFALNVAPTNLVADKAYFLSFDIETNADLPRVYMKVHKNGDDDHYLDISSLSISAGKQTVSGVFENTGDIVLHAMDNILFDFGSNPENATIIISNITICDDFSGESEPFVPYICNGEGLLSSVHFEIGTVYYAPGWNLSSNYTASWENGALMLHLADGTYEAWQAQFPLDITPIDLIADKTYFLSFDIETNAALPRVYMKAHQKGDDDRYLDIPSLAVSAGKQTVSSTFKNTGDITLYTMDEILFDLGGNPENATITISNITICDNFSEAIATRIPKALFNSAISFDQDADIIRIYAEKGVASAKLYTAGGSVAASGLAEIPTAPLAKGIYILKIEDATGRTAAFKTVVK